MDNSEMIMFNYTKKEIEKKKKMIECYESFIETAALKYDEEHLKNDKLLSELRAVTDKKSKKDTRYAEEIRERLSESLYVLECYYGIMKDLEESLNIRIGEFDRIFKKKKEILRNELFGNEGSKEENVMVIDGMAENK